MNLRLLFLAGAAAGATVASAPLQAQTHTAAHHTTATAHHTPVKSECVTIPDLSTKLPAVPPGSLCPKSMVSVSIVEKVDLSPMVGPALRKGFTNVSTNFTLAYVDEKIGTGPLALPQMYYTVQYTGYLADGTKFDSSLDHGDKKTLSFPYGAHRVIPGWDLGFEGMHIGGKRRLYIPYQLGYGERGRPPIPPKAELIFDMELIAQSPTDPDAPPAPPAGSPAGQGTPMQPGQPLIQGQPAPGTAPAPSTTPAPSGLPATPPSARPQTGPDTKPAPPTPGSTPPSSATPPTAKQPPPS